MEIFEKFMKNVEWFGKIIILQKCCQNSKKIFNELKKNEENRKFQTNILGIILESFDENNEGKLWWQ